MWEVWLWKQTVRPWEWLKEPHKQLQQQQIQSFHLLHTLWRWCGIKVNNVCVMVSPFLVETNWTCNKSSSQTGWFHHMKPSDIQNNMEDSPKLFHMICSFWRYPWWNKSARLCEYLMNNRFNNNEQTKNEDCPGYQCIQVQRLNCDLSTCGKPSIHEVNQVMSLEKSECKQRVQTCQVVEVAFLHWCEVVVRQIPVDIWLWVFIMLLPGWSKVTNKYVRFCGSLFAFWREFRDIFLYDINNENKWCTEACGVEGTNSESRLDSEKSCSGTEVSPLYESVLFCDSMTKRRNWKDLNGSPNKLLKDCGAFPLKDWSELWLRSSDIRFGGNWSISMLFSQLYERSLKNVWNVKASKKKRCERETNRMVASSTFRDGTSSNLLFESFLCFIGIVQCGSVAMDEVDRLEQTVHRCGMS